MSDSQASSFVGERLREAREALGLSAQNVGDLVGVSRVSITNYETNKTTPRAEVVSHLALVLKQPLEFFFDPHVNSEFDPAQTHFRTTKLVSTELGKASVRARWMLEFFDFLQTNLELPPLNLPDRSEFASPQASEEAIELAASDVRLAWGVPDGPFLDLVHWSEANGVVVARIDLDLPKLDGLSFYSMEWDRPFVLLNGTKASYVRSRFDLAHELGHMVLHRSVLARHHGASDHARLEREAHRFAAALLMPRDSWLRDLRGRVTLGSLKALKPKWHTSIGAMIIRARDLNVISDDEHRSLWKQYSGRRWRAKEPFDDLWVPEEPRLLREATQVLAEPPLGLAVVQRAFCRSPAILSEMTSLPEKVFEPPSPIHGAQAHRSPESMN